MTNRSLKNFMYSYYICIQIARAFYESKNRDIDR